MYTPKDNLSIEDFLGNNGSSLEPSVEGFKEIFEQTLDLSGKSYTMAEIIAELEKGTRYSNDIHNPGLEALAFIVDCVSFGIKALFDCISGYDIITGEELSDSEQGWRGVDAALSLLDIFGITKLASMGLKTIGREVLEEVAEQAGKKVIQETGERIGKEVLEEAGEQIGKEVLEETGEQLGKEVLEETSEEIGKEIAEEASEEIGKEVLEEAGEEIGKEAIEETSEQIGKEIAEETGEEIGKEVGEEAQEEIAKEIIEEGGKLADESAEKVIGVGGSYSNFADAMSPEDRARYIALNEEKFFGEFSERASGAGLSDAQIAEAFEAMRNGDYAKMATYFDTSSPVDGAVFWSGNKEGAATYATNTGGTIMEQTPGGQVFDNWRGLGGMYPEWDTPTNLAQKPIWDALSSQYANGAEGVATYVHPNGYTGKVWTNIEKPILEENDIIIQEVIIDAK